MLQRRRLRPDRARVLRASASPTPRSPSFADLALYVMTPEYGAATQLEKIDMLDYADVVALNKFDRRGAARRPARRQEVSSTRNRKAPGRCRSRSLCRSTGPMASHGSTIPAPTRLYSALLQRLRDKSSAAKPARVATSTCPSGLSRDSSTVIPPASASRYLARDRRRTTVVTTTGPSEQSGLPPTASYRARRSADLEAAVRPAPADACRGRARRTASRPGRSSGSSHPSLARRRSTAGTALVSSAIRTENHVFHGARQGPSRSAQFTKLPVRPRRSPRSPCRSYRSLGRAPALAVDRERPRRQFPFAAGVFPFKRTAEDPTRMFAGEGGPERTNRRFHYVVRRVSRPSACRPPSTRSPSTATTPTRRPDIYGKIGNAGVAICTARRRQEALLRLRPVRTRRPRCR